jgi:alcohol dehydrogenase class IV
MKGYGIFSKLNSGNFDIILNYIKTNKFDRVLILSSKSIVLLNEVNQFIIDLNDITEVEIFSNIRPNAPTSDLDIIVKTYVRPSLIIGIGGGSVLDSAKALSVGWGGIDTCFSAYLNGSAKLYSNKITMVAVPTTAGTGSELSYGAILYDEINNFKGGIRSQLMVPELVLIYPELYKHLQFKSKAEVGFDCLSHAIETFLSRQSNDFVKYQSIYAIVNIFKNLYKSINNDLNSIKSMALTSSFMGVNLAQSTTCLPHRIQYALGPLSNSSHAVGIIILYKGWLEIVSKTSEFNNLSKILSDFNIDLMFEISNLKNKLDINYSLFDLGVTEMDFDYLIKNTKGNLGDDPSYVSNETIFKILHNSL